MTVPDDVRKAVGYGALGFGLLAVLSPRLFLGIYGIPDENNVRLMTRVWGTRTTFLGALTLMLRDAEDQRTLMAGAAAMEAVDTLLISTSHTPMRARVLGAATTGTFAAATAYAASR